MPDMFDGLEAEIAAAVRGESAVAPAAPAPDASATPALADAPAPDAGAKPADAPAETSDGRARGPDGKFIAAADGGKPDAGKAATTAPAGDKPDEKPLQPPSHWSPEAKAAFVNAPRAVQQEALKREEEISGKAKEWQGKAEDYNRLDKVIAPHRDRLTREGRDPATAISQLFAFENAMLANSVTGTAAILRAFAPGNELGVIAKIAEQNGLKLVKADNQGQPGSGQPAPTNPDDPIARRLNEIAEQVQKLTQTTVQQQQSTKEQQEQQANARRQAVLDQVAAFAKDPAHLYYENVKVQMGALLRIGDEAGDARPIQERLKEAYEQAVHANPQTRTIVLAEQQRKQQTDEAARAEAARRAAVSVTGSPGPGAAHVRSSGSNSNSIEDDVRASVASLRA